jgi:hypothetical protein
MKKEIIALFCVRKRFFFRVPFTFRFRSRPWGVLL